MDGNRPRRELRPALEGLESIVSLSAAASRPALLARGIGRAPNPAPEVFTPGSPTLTAEKSLPPSSETLEVRVTTDRRVYRVGQPIRITLTETAIGQWPVRVERVPRTFVRAYAPGITLWSDLAPSIQTADRVFVEPGQSRQTTIVWHPNRERGASSPSGLVTIEGTFDGVAASPTSIRILGGRA